jgi:hypothetical protein
LWDGKFTRSQASKIRDSFWRRFSPFLMLQRNKMANKHAISGQTAGHLLFIDTHMIS